MKLSDGLKIRCCRGGDMHAACRLCFESPRVYDETKPMLPADVALVTGENGPPKASSAGSATTSRAPVTSEITAPPEAAALDKKLREAHGNPLGLHEHYLVPDCECGGCDEIRGNTPAAGTDPGYMQVHAELEALHIRKSSTYGTDGERFHNFIALAEVTGFPPEYYAWLRIAEKAVRAVNQIQAGDPGSVKEGPDVAGLAIIAEALRRRSA